MTTLDFKRILIIATRQIGDVLCTTPLMRRAREVWPDAVIDVLGYEKTMGMLTGNPDINEVIESSEHPKWPEYKLLIKRIFRKYDLAIVTQPSDRAHIYGLLAAPLRVGMVPKNWKLNWWKRLLLTKTETLDYWNKHAITERLALISHLGGTRALNSAVEVVPPRGQALPDDLTSFCDGISYIVCHPSSLWQHKTWTMSNWVELISKLKEKGIKVVITGGASNVDLRYNMDICQNFRDNKFLYDAGGKLSFGQACTLLRSSLAYVGVDTAMTHLSASTGARTIALFGPTPPTNFGPWPMGEGIPRNPIDKVWNLRGCEMPAFRDHLFQTKSNVTVLQFDYPCLPCRRSGCNDKRESRSACVDSIKPDAVLKALFK